MSLTSFLANVAGGISTAARVERQMQQRKAAARPAARPAPRPTVPPAQALGLTGASPFAGAMRQQRQRVQQAASKLPNPPTLRQVAQGYRDSYRQALVDTFLHQPKPVQQRIVANAIRRPTDDGRIILSHVTGLSGARLDGYIKTFQDTGFHDHSVFDSIGNVAREIGSAVKSGLTPYSPTEIGTALSNPSGYQGTLGAFQHPDLARAGQLQQLLSGVSSTLGKAVDRGQQSGVLGSKGLQPQTAGFNGGQVGVNFLKDAVNLPAEVIPSAYLPASEAASGHVGAAARMLAQPYIDLAKHPVRSLQQHPLDTALMVAGPVRGVAGAVGEAGRRAGIGAFSTERAPAVVPGTNVAQARSWSRDPLVKGVQVLRASRARRAAADMATQAAQLEAQAAHDPANAAHLQQRADELRHEAASMNPDVLKPHAVAKLVDHLEGSNQGIQSAHRAEVVRAPQLLIKQAKAAGHAISPIAQGIVKPTLEDLQAYRDDLARVHASGALSPAEAKANIALRAGLDRSIANAAKGKFNPADVPALVQQHYAPLMQQLEKKLDDAGILPAARAERAKLIPFAARMGMRDASNADIATAMEHLGHGEPSFVTQAPNRRGPGNFYRHWSNPGGVGSATRTGEATVKGTFDAHPETMVEQVARMQGLVDAHEGFGRFLDQFGLRHDGRLASFDTRAAAEQAARDASALPGSQGWQIVRTAPWKGRVEDVAGMIDGSTPEGHAQQSLSDILDAAVRGDGEGPYTLVPKPAADRLREHVSVLGAGGGGKLFRLATGAFRRTVLATSPTWLAGNVIEAGTRAAINRATPMDALFARRVFAHMDATDPEAALSARIAAKPGGHYAFAGRTVRTAADQFRDASPPLANLARAAGAFWQARGPRNLANLWQGYTHLVFTKVNDNLEAPAQLAMAGRHMRQRFGLSNAEVIASRRAVQQAADGLRNTPEQIAMARAVQRAYGQYSSFSPALRKAIALYTPFASWSLNAVRFLYHVLPADHPVLTALLADAHVASEQWRKQHGLDLFQGSRGLPSFLQGSIPTAGGGHLRIGRYTPFGFASQPLDTVAGLVLPQLSGVQAAFQGRDWKGRALKNADGTPYDQLQLFKYGVQQLAEGEVPVYGKAAQFAAARGSLGQRLVRVLNPFAVTKGRASAAGPAVGIPTVNVPSVNVPTVNVPTVNVR